ncbi:hypothetical protein [Massilia genomosp. 1]|uniref:hypothetical protein n=1 Tax=Massilia genomosp. 1 TaxID=2609280 RepID=UPI00141DE456|nr:hypothetical protein [Massilia genomosp. 1]
MQQADANIDILTNFSVFFYFIGSSSSILQIFSTCITFALYLQVEQARMAHTYGAPGKQGTKVPIIQLAG